MGLSSYQRDVCRLIAANRRRSGESYFAGGATLNELIAAPRLSRDIDVFHDTEEALQASWHADRLDLERAGYAVRTVRERPGFVEAEVRRGPETVLMEWARDSAFRFFPLVEHDELGLVLHPFDLATSKVLALVGRVEPRDFLDVVNCDREVQPLGYLAWAACGKDPGFSPAAILEEAARASRYTVDDFQGLDFEGGAPDPGELMRAWHALLGAARFVVNVLPSESAGRAVLDRAGRLFRGDVDALEAAVASGELRYHSGSIRGALPRIV
ncbi:MAG TPA: hypothetical protein PLE61_02430 [Vicinamibacterales bacterium]|nr:hypothetical protein [Vicinamibacterales bacterium]HPW19644.1 hypothetical protein [Vicinamibacterales bacterium]